MLPCQAWRVAGGIGVEGGSLKRQCSDGLGAGESVFLGGGKCADRRMG